MWLFVDESWSPDGRNPAYGVMLGALVRHDQLDRLENLLFAIRRKYYGREQAKNLSYELKGNELLSNYVLRLWKPRSALPRNLCVVRELISYPQRHPQFYIRLFASTVYSADVRPPSLLSPDPKKLADPFRHLLESASRAAAEDAPGRTITLVFDQRRGAQKEIAIAVRNFVGGMNLPNVHRHPYVAVSNVSPGIQVADIFAHLLSKRVQKVRAIMELYEGMKSLQWESRRQPKRYGFQRLDEIRTAGRVEYGIRRQW
jgi:hypothetical protein